MAELRVLSIFIDPPHRKNLWEAGVFALGSSEV